MRTARARGRSLLEAGDSLPGWPFALAVAILTWGVTMVAAAPGLDGSWNAGLTMAVHQGLHFGDQIVFSYGPLGFLQSPYVLFDAMAVASFLYSAALYLGLAVALVAALRRSLPLAPSAVLAFLLLALLPPADQPLALAVLVALAMLAPERAPRSPLALAAFAVFAASFAAVEVLVKLSTGPAIAVVMALALLGARARPWLLLGAAALFVAELLGLWLLAGQDLATVPGFLSHSWEVLSAYSTAMLREVEVAPWKVTMATIAAALISLALVAACATQGGFRDARARWFAAAAMAVAAFVTFKEGVVRTDAGHLSLYFATACLLWIAIPWRPRRWPLLLAGVAVIALIGLPVRVPGMGTKLDAVANVGTAATQFRNLLSPGRRAGLRDEGRAGLRSIYRIEPRVLAALREGDPSVAVEPWETAVAWAYDFPWNPLPVFQNYSAYTTGLDDLNAAAVESPDGPARILRENPQLVFAQFKTLDLDDRYVGWDPPAQQLAELCHFTTLAATQRWLALGRTADRCAAPRPVGSAEAAEGVAVPVPEAGPGEVVFTRIHGAGVAGLEKLQSLLLHARTRRLVLDGGVYYRLIPETAGDGLLLRGDPAVAPPAPFSPLPQTTTVAVEGSGGPVRFDFYAMRIRPAPKSPSASAP
jgi:hypothetical protein